MKKSTLLITALIGFFFMGGVVNTKLIAQGESHSPVLVSNTVSDVQKGKMVSLADLLAMLEQNFDATFLFKDKVVQHKWVNTGNIQMGENTGQQLAKILDQLNLAYYQLDRQTYVLLPSKNVSNQGDVQEQISGTVTDALTGEPLAGANIGIVGTSMGTSTDQYGKYVLNKVPAGNHVLKVSYIGYKSKEIKIDVSNRAIQRDISLSSKTIKGEEITIESRRRGQVRALNQQKTALNIKNVVSQELIQRFPDNQIAEGLKRIPGITTDHDYGEASNVRIRAMSPNLNSTTVNGISMASNSSKNRGVNLASMSSSMIQTIEVNKSLTPDMDADAIGGTINFVTKDPFHGKGSIFNLSGGWNYNEQALSSSGYDFQGTYGNTAGKFGYLFSASMNKYHRAEESVHYEWAEPRKKLEEFQLYNYDVNRKKVSGSTNFFYNFNDQSKIYLKGMYNYYNDAQYTPKFNLYDLGGENTTVSNNIQQIPNGTGNRKNGYREYKRDLATVVGGGEHVLSNGWNIDYKGAWSYGRDTQPFNYDTEFNRPLSVKIDQSDINFPTISFPDGDPYDPSSFTLISVSNKEDTTHTNKYIASFDIEAPFETGKLTGTIKWGGKAQRTHAEDHRNEFDAEPLEGGGAQVTMDSYLWDSYDKNHEIYGGYKYGPLPNSRTVFNEVYQRNPSQFEYLYDPEDALADYKANENIVAGYAMGTINFNDLLIIGGVRYEYTYMDYTGYQISIDATESEEAELSTNTSQYGGFYPMLQLRYQLMPNLNLRVSATRSYARPNYEDLIPYKEIDEEDQEVSQGNPELEPYQATNLDLMVEKYIGSIGLLSAGIYYKDLGDYIVDVRSVQDDGQYRGYDIETPENASNAQVYGFELSAQQELTFLPGVLEGIGLYANYTYNHTKLEAPGQERDTPIPGQIPHVWNLSLMYEKYGFSGSVSLHNQAEIIDDLGATPADDEYFGSRTQIDLYASQQLSSNFILTLSIKNLTNEPYRYYGTEPGGNRIPFENAIYAWEGSLGLKFAL